MLSRCHLCLSEPVAMARKLGCFYNHAGQVYLGQHGPDRALQKHYLVFLVLKRGTMDWGSSGVVSIITQPSGKNLMYLQEKTETPKHTTHTHSIKHVLGVQCPSLLGAVGWKLKHHQNNSTCSRATGTAAFYYHP